MAWPINDTFVVYMCCCHSFLRKSPHKQDGSYVSTNLSKPCHTRAMSTTDFPGGIANNPGAQQRVTTSLRMTDLYCRNQVAVYMFPAFANLCNSEIALRKLEITKLYTNFKMGIWFRNCVALLCIIEIALFLKQTPPMITVVARSAWCSV